VVAAGFILRIVLTGQLWEIIAGTTVAGAGTGIAYAAMPALISLGAPHAELAEANGLNTLCRASGQLAGQRDRGAPSWPPRSSR